MEKTNKFDYIKIKNFFLSKDIIKRMKSKPEWEKMSQHK